MANNKAFKVKKGLQAGRYLQSSGTVSSGSLDLSTGTYFTFTPTANTTVAFTNPPASGKAMAFTLALPRTTYTITFPSSVKWEGGTTPTFVAGDTTYMTFITTDGGTTYYGKAVKVY